MTDTPRKTPEYQPWQIVAPEYGGDLSATFESLTECEKQCKMLALANHGFTFRPVKYGRPFLAVKEERVVLK